MPDREKVIEGLEAMREFFGFGLPSQAPVFEAYQNILTDTIALLKEQEAVKPNGTRKAMSFSFNGMLTGYCPRCGTIINSIGNPGACGKCGQKLDWE